MRHVFVLVGDEDLAGVVALCLEDAGLRVTVTHGPDEILPSADVDVAVIDLALVGAHTPAIAGLDTIRRLRSRFPDLRIVALSWSDVPRRMAEEAGADAIVTKPFGIDELVDAVRR